MASLVSGSASLCTVTPTLTPTLQLDPALHVQGQSRWRGRFVCCSFSCCNKRMPERLMSNSAIYCDKNGRVSPFDFEKADDEQERIRKTSERVKDIVSASKPLDYVKEETGVDLEEKAANAHIITVHEIKMIEKVLAPPASI